MEYRIRWCSLSTGGTHEPSNQAIPVTQLENDNDWDHHTPEESWKKQKLNEKSKENKSKQKFSQPFQKS